MLDSLACNITSKANLSDILKCCAFFTLTSYIYVNLVRCNEQYFKKKIEQGVYMKIITI